MKSEQARQLYYEIDIQRRNSDSTNPNCCKIHYCYEETNRIYLVTDLYKGQTIYEWYLENYANVSEFDSLRMIVPLIKGLVYLKDKAIIH